MKDVFLFVLAGFDSLLRTLKVGLVGYATDFKPIGGTTIVHLFLADGQIVKIYSEMHDLDSWNEIGSLVFESVGECRHSKMIPLEAEWRNISSIKKLVLNRENFIAESGIVLYSNAGEALMIVTSANVDTLAVKAPMSCDEFLPENDLSSYQYLPLE